jgi:hypothetical protein
MQNLTAKTRYSLLLTPFALAMALSACSTDSTGPIANGSNNPVFAEPLDKSEVRLAPRELATLIFYRPGTPTGADKPLNVYVNGRFLSSLLPGGYIEHSNCAGPMQVAAVFDDARIRHLGQRGHESEVTLEAGKTYYFQVDETGGGNEAKLMSVPSREVFLGQYRRQSHVLTRAPNCVTTAAPVAPVATTPVVAAPIVAAPLVAATKPMPAAAPKLETSRVVAPLESWRAAWERGDYAAYTGFYAPGFKGTMPSRSAWEQLRRARLNNSAKSIHVDDLAVTGTSDSVITDFKQVYHSKQFDDNGQKRLVWKDFGGQLKIVEEIFSGKTKK